MDITAVLVVLVTIVVVVVGFAGLLVQAVIVWRLGSRSGAVVPAFLGGAGVVLGGLVCITSRPLAVWSLGGESGVLTAVFFRNMNALGDRQWLFLQGGGVLFALGLVLILCAAALFVVGSVRARSSTPAAS